MTLHMPDRTRAGRHPARGAAAAPIPYVGTYLLLRIDDPEAGRELVRRLHPRRRVRRDDG